MNDKIKNIKNMILGEQLDFRIKLFNIMAAGGACMSFITLIQSIVISMWDISVISFILMILSLGLLLYAIRSEKYQRCYDITIAVIFFIFFPLLFFKSGGYKSGVPAIFIFAVIFTTLMLDGKKAIIVSTAELILYSYICYLAYCHPTLVVQYKTEKEVLFDIIFSYSTIGFICVIVLYFHLKEYSRQRELLREKNEKLQHYDEVKSTFLTTVAHEVKNPLNIIGLYAQDTSELTEEEPVNLEEIRNNQTIIKNTVMRLDQILMDLMDTVSIEQGRLKLSLAPMDTVELMKEVIHFWKDKSERNEINGNRIVFDIPESSAPVMADYTRILQVMTNLFSNAVRHTHNGVITLTLKKIENGQFISVEDTGEGMDPEVRENVFKGYVSTNKDYWRHGIGLYICHQIIKAHGGTIKIQSEPGKGTKISFTIPDKEV